MGGGSTRRNGLVSNERPLYEQRDGVRGGRSQFNWEDVKADKYRHNYLGNSVHASVGRWQEGRDILWYTRDSNANMSAEQVAEHRRSEQERVRQQELAMMNQALGLGGLGAIGKPDHQLSSLSAVQGLSEGPSAGTVGKETELKVEKKPEEVIEKKKSHRRDRSRFRDRVERRRDRSRSRLRGRRDRSRSRSRERRREHSRSRYESKNDDERSYGSRDYHRRHRDDRDETDRRRTKYSNDRSRSPVRRRHRSRSGESRKR